MPSRRPSRRRLLAGVGSCLAVGGAGCTGIDESETTVGSGDDGGEPGPSDEYDLLTLRSSDDSFFVYPQGGRPDEAETDRSGPYRRSVRFVTDEDEADALRIEAGDVDAAEARTFLAETDFETESVVVEQRSIEDCYRRHVLTVQADSDGFRTRYCQTLKSPSAPCEADLDAMEALFFRVRHAYDDAPSSRSSGESRSCSNSVVEDSDTRGTETEPENGSVTDAEDGR